MDSLVLVERRAFFHEALIKIVHRHHVEFLKVSTELDNNY
jgi:hypothetical protein